MRRSSAWRIVGAAASRVLLGAGSAASGNTSNSASALLVGVGALLVRVVVVLVRQVAVPVWVEAALVGRVDRNGKERKGKGRGKEELIMV